MPLKLEVADCDHLQKLLSFYDIHKAHLLGQRNAENRDIQLCCFVNVINIEKLFSVDSTSSNDRKYLVWKNTGEEAVLHFQGIASQICVTPFRPDSPGRIARPGVLRQFIQVVSDPDDSIFQEARAAEKAIQKFMWQYGRNPDHLVLHDSTFGGIPALYADSKLLTAPSQPVGTTIPIHADMEEKNALTRLCQDTRHRYTDDNAVSYFEWYCLDDNTMRQELHCVWKRYYLPKFNSLQPRDSGRAIRAGHLVDIGVTFRLLLGKRGDVRFISKLDSITIIDRSSADVKVGRNEEKCQYHRTTKQPEEKKDCS
ncbi:uncharacterized protein EV420DRAFT_1488243 [Desarmillaria tabescens]|uniref:Uncharacterized protein n=1 Tax=Armillaria tabescens TaxID=1929756 RepID=A0AA39J5B1_ARMTA|nr:uncharacterized protein EV420DRAFT_1488243 [Desarmillaria tabescens]KAK0435099.1 hypothetical protein EV420DRAFT_1488243 [Desarmillaria tabescens]